MELQDGLHGGRRKIRVTETGIVPEARIGGGTGGGFRSVLRREDEFVADLGLDGAESGHRVGDAAFRGDVGDFEGAEDAGVAADGEGDAGHDLFGHEDFEGDEAAVLGVFDVFLDAADEEGFGDHACAAEFGVAFFEVALGEEAFFLDFEFAFALDAVLDGFEFLDGVFGGLEFAFHGVELGGVGEDGSGVGLELLDLFFEFDAVLFGAELGDLSLEAGDFVRRGVLHSLGHVHEGHAERTKKEGDGGAKQKFHRIHGRDGGWAGRGCQRGFERRIEVVCRAWNWWAGCLVCGRGG